MQEGRGDYFLRGDTFGGGLMPDNFTSQKAEPCNHTWISNTLSGVMQCIAASLAENMQLNIENLVKYFRTI